VENEVSLGEHEQNKLGPTNNLMWSLPIPIYLDVLERRIRRASMLWSSWSVLSSAPPLRTAWQTVAGELS